MAQTVPAGPYFGYTYLQLTAELGSLISQRQAISSLLGSTVNGQSFNRESSEAQLRSLEARTQSLHEAMSCLRPDKHAPAPSNRAVISFGHSCPQ